MHDFQRTIGFVRRLGERFLEYTNFLLKSKLQSGNSLFVLDSNPHKFYKIFDGALRPLKLVIVQPGAKMFKIFDLFLVENCLLTISNSWRNHILLAFMIAKYEILSGCPSVSECFSWSKIVGSFLIIKIWFSLT